MTTKQDILNFIKEFQNEGTIEKFSNGCCYWFALILEIRFKDLELNELPCRIMYNQIDGHFACDIDGNLYDITGQIDYNDNWVPWVNWCLSEPSYRQVVVRDCILKLKT